MFSQSMTAVSATSSEKRVVLWEWNETLRELWQAPTKRQMKRCDVRTGTFWTADGYEDVRSSG